MKRALRMVCERFVILPIPLSLSRIRAAFSVPTLCLGPLEVSILLPSSSPQTVALGPYHSPSGLWQTSPPLAKALVLRTFRLQDPPSGMLSMVGVRPKKGKGGREGQGRPGASQEGNRL